MRNEIACCTTKVCVCACVYFLHYGIGPKPYSVIYAVANPVRGHKEVNRSTGQIIVTTHYLEQQELKSRTNPCQV